MRVSDLRSGIYSVYAVRGKTYSADNSLLFALIKIFKSFHMSPQSMYTFLLVQQKNINHISAEFFSRLVNRLRGKLAVPRICFCTYHRILPAPARRVKRYSSLNRLIIPVILCGVNKIYTALKRAGNHLSALCLGQSGAERTYGKRAEAYLRNSDSGFAEHIVS